MPPRKHASLPLTDWYMTLDELVQYSGISRRQLERLRQRADNPLRPSNLNGRRPLFLKSHFDAWAATECPPAPLQPPARSADEIIAEVKARHARATDRGDCC